MHVILYYTVRAWNCGCRVQHRGHRRSEGGVSEFELSVMLALLRGASIRQSPSTTVVMSTTVCHISHEANVTAAAQKCEELQILMRRWPFPLQPWINGSVASALCS